LRAASTITRLGSAIKWETGNNPSSTRGIHAHETPIGVRIEQGRKWLVQGLGESSTSSNFTYFPE